MKREEAIAEIKARWQEFYPRAKMRGQIVCPLCGHGTHGDGIKTNPASDNQYSLKCFGCDFAGDILDLIQKDKQIDFNDALQYAADRLGLQIDRPQRAADGRREYARPMPGNQNRTKREQPAENDNTNNIHTTVTQYTIDDIEDSPKLDFTEVLDAAHRDLLNNPAALDHFLHRGLSMGTIERYRLGYAPAGHNSLLKAFPQNMCKSEKAGLYQYIFPYIGTDGRATYFVSEIADRQQVDDYNGKYRKLNKGSTPETAIAAELFNERYLQQPPEAIYICEGIFDALAVEEAGGKAIAIMGTGQKRLLGLCKKYSPETSFIISLDNDKAGQQATAKITEGLDFLHIPYIIKTAATGKDFNDALVSDRQAFVDFVKATEQEAIDKRLKILQEAMDAYKETSALNHLQGFIDSIEHSRTASYYPTGFSSLDTLIDGGLYAGLYVIGAISSLGKTTFTLQLMDNIAASGNDVIIFSLEMSMYELMAKSISRHTLLEDLRQHGTTNHAKTTRGITTGKRYQSYSNEDRSIIAAAVKAYSQYASHIYIKEGVGNIGVDEIRQQVEEHIKLTGNRPVIMIDYLQILAPQNERLTDKQATDRNILELKRISRDYSIPVIGISSFNRDNYTAPVNMASFKESGAVEYSSDVLIGLQYSGMDWQQGENEKNRNDRLRQLMKDLLQKGKQGQGQDIQVKILKNRNGSKGETELQYFPMFNYFTEPSSSTGTAITASNTAEQDAWQKVSAGSDIPFDEGSLSDL